MCTQDRDLVPCGQRGNEHSEDDVDHGHVPARCWTWVFMYINPFTCWFCFLLSRNSTLQVKKTSMRSLLLEVTVTKQFEPGTLRFKAFDQYGQDKGYTGMPCWSSCLEKKTWTFTFNPSVWVCLCVSLYDLFLCASLSWTHSPMVFWDKVSLDSSGWPLSPDSFVLSWE